LKRGEIKVDKFKKLKNLYKVKKRECSQSFELSHWYFFGTFRHCFRVEAYLKGK